MQFNILILLYNETEFLIFNYFKQPFIFYMDKSTPVPTPIT